MFALKTKYIDEPSVKIVNEGKYHSTQQNCFRVKSDTGEMICQMSMAIPDYGSLKDDECFLKSYSENEGLLEALLAQGIIKDLGISMNSGFVNLRCVRILRFE